MSDNRLIIEKTLEELSGVVFKNQEPYSEKSKVFFEDRYFKMLSVLPKITKDSVGLEVGLAGGVLAFSLKRIFSLNKLYTLEHPSVCKQYSDFFIEKVKKEKIILKSVDLHNEQFPWSDNFFDFVVLSEVIEHLIPSDIPRVISEIQRVLKKKGHLVITTPNISSLLKRINLLRGKNPIEFDLLLHEGATYGHIREYTMNEIEQIIKDRKMKIVNKKFFMIDSKRNMFTKIEELSSKFISSLGNNLALVAEK